MEDPVKIDTVPRPILRGPLGFVVGALVLAAVLAIGSKALFSKSARDRSVADCLGGKTPVEYFTKLGETLLQLSVIVVAGGLAKGLVDWGLALRGRQTEQNTKRLELLRRVRTVHVTIENARDLLNAHESAKTYGEQLRRLMALRPEVEEISEEVAASVDLFVEKAHIRAGLERIVTYLKAGAEEYVKGHKEVDAAHKRGEGLMDTLRAKKMEWVTDLMETGTKYSATYLPNLLLAKQTIRAETYGA
jgi:hypothetical protein